MQVTMKYFYYNFYYDTLVLLKKYLYNNRITIFIKGYVII